MYGLRSLVCVLGFTLWHALRAALGGVLGFPRRADGFYEREPRAWARHILRATALEVRVSGLERLDPAQPYVFAANHASLADIWVLLGTLPGSVRFIAKRELYSVPILGAALEATGQIPVDRQRLESATHSYEDAAREVRAGRSVIVFVEGTRTRTGRLQELKKGAFVLAIVAGVPLVPVYLSGTFRILPRGSLWLRRGSVGVTIGEPLETEGLAYDDRDRLLHEVRRWFEARQGAVDAAEGQT